MAVSEHGARVAAGRLGITVKAYRQHEAAGEHWCAVHQDWHPSSRFGRDPSKVHGLASACRTARSTTGGSRPQRAWFLTPEGAAVATSAHAARSAPTACAQNATVTPSGPHAHCPTVLGCREGRLPWGWVREAGR